MNEEYSDMFSELSGYSGSKKYESMAHVLLSFVGRTYEQWMDQQYTDLQGCRRSYHPATFVIEANGESNEPQLLQFIEL